MVAITHQIYGVKFLSLKDRQQEAMRDSRCLILLYSYVQQSIMSYTK